MGGSSMLSSGMAPRCTRPSWGTSAGGHLQPAGHGRGRGRVSAPPTRRTLHPRSGGAPAATRGDASRRVAIPGRLTQQQLDHYDVTPVAVEPAVPHVSPHLAPAAAAHERRAGGVVREDLAGELPVAELLGPFGQARQQGTADSTTASRTIDVDRDLAHSRVDASLAVGGDAAPA